MELQIYSSRAVALSHTLGRESIPTGSINGSERITANFECVARHDNKNISFIAQHRKKKAEKEVGQQEETNK